MLMESLLKFAKYFWSVTEKNSILLDNFRSRPVGMRVNRWWLNFHFCLKHVFKACELSHWALNTLNRTQRGWHCSRKAFRHIRRARTMWEPVFSNIKPFSPWHRLIHLTARVTFLCQAIHGQAIDRHLLGLKMLSIEDLTSMPGIFMDTSFAVAQHYNLNTSQVYLHPGKTVHCYRTNDYLLSCVCLFVDYPGWL